MVCYVVLNDLFMFILWFCDVVFIVFVLLFFFFFFFLLFCLFFFFFFQAEDGIRDWSVTGVQTCALPSIPDHNHLSLQPNPRLHDALQVHAPQNSVQTHGGNAWDM